MDWKRDLARMDRMIEACEELAERLGIHVVRDSMSSLGGLCRFKGQWRLYLNDALTPDEAIEVYAKAFARFDLGDRYVLPALRDEIERHGER